MFELIDHCSEFNSPKGENYWTGAKWSAACTNYVWCPGKEIIGPDVKWKKGFPKSGSGSCVGIHLGNSNPDENGLYNGKCSEITKLFCIVSDHSQFKCRM
jgi:hypothetical protein